MMNYKTRQGMSCDLWISIAAFCRGETDPVVIGLHKEISELCKELDNDPGAAPTDKQIELGRALIAEIARLSDVADVRENAAKILEGR